MDLFPFHLIVFLNYNDKDKEEVYTFLHEKIQNTKRLLDIIKVIDVAELEADRGTTFSNGPAQLIIMKDFDIKNLENICVLSHELEHVVWSAARYMGVVPSEDSEEFYMNLKDGLMFKVLKEINNDRDNIR